MNPPDGHPAVAVLGTGALAEAIAERLHALGWPLRVPSQARAVIVCAADAAQCRQLLFAQGAAQALPLGAGVLLCVPMAPADAQSIAAGLHRQGLHAAHAQASGSPALARTGRLGLRVACGPSAWLRCRELAQALSDKAQHTGEIGAPP